MPGIETWGPGLPITFERSVLQSVVIPGFPPHAEEVDITYSTGKISNPKVTVDENERIKLDIAVSPGNSGGPLVNEDYEVMGVVYMKITQEAVENVAYAIPIKAALDLIDSIENYSDVEVVKNILNEKIEEFMLFIQFNINDDLIPLHYFTHEYKKAFQTIYVQVFAICNDICDSSYYYSIEELPDISTSQGYDLFEEIYRQVQNADLFEKAGLQDSGEEFEIVLLVSCYKYICQLMESLDTFDLIISSLDIDANEEEVFAYYIEILFELCVHYLIDDVVTYRFKDMEIDKFEVVQVDPDLRPTADTYTTRIYIKVKYMDSVKNLTIQAAYSRGRWGISSITGA